MKNSFWKFTLIFCSLFILTFPFEYTFLPSISSVLNLFFENLVFWSGTFIFGLPQGFDTTIASDSLGLYIHVVNLLFISILFSVLWINIYNKENAQYWFEKTAVYYLSLQMFLYGFDKVFKAQFYLPEPNLLHTNLGDLTPDLLYWSTIGISWGYSFFLGAIEIIVAALLLSHRTRLLGILLGIGVMANVVAVNFFYDISVKVYACFLLGLFLVLFLPYIKFLYQALILKTTTEVKRKNAIPSPKHRKLMIVVKLIIIILFAVESVGPFVFSDRYNDDLATRPLFHGAYDITNTINASSFNKTDIKQVFIHRAGYLITKNDKNEMQDYQLIVDTVQQQITVIRYDLMQSYILDYTSKDNNLTSLKGIIDKQEINVILTKKDANLLQQKGNFHWTTMR